METSLTWRGTMAAGVFAAGAFAGASEGQAAACAYGRLSDYLPGGTFAPCTVGELTFSNFTFDPGNSGYQPRWPYLYQFNGRFIIGVDLSVYDPTFLTVGFTVTAPAGRVITEIANSLFSYMLVDPGLAETRATASNGTVVTVLQDYPDGTPYATSARPSDSESFTGVNSLDIAYRLSAEGSILFNGEISFTVADAPRLTEVPEPSTLALFGLGLTGLAALRARRRARRTEAVAH